MPTGVFRYLSLSVSAIAIYRGESDFTMFHDLSVVSKTQAKPYSSQNTLSSKFDPEVMPVPARNKSSIFAIQQNDICYILIEMRQRF